jgi:hypothetical protein
MVIRQLQGMECKIVLGNSVEGLPSRVCFSIVNRPEFVNLESRNHGCNTSISSMDAKDFFFLVRTNFGKLDVTCSLS